MVPGSGIKPVSQHSRDAAHPIVLQWELQKTFFSPPPFFFFPLGPHLWHIEVPRLGVKSEMQLLAYTIGTATATATAMPDPS